MDIPFGAAAGLLAAITLLLLAHMSTKLSQVQRQVARLARHFNLNVDAPMPPSDRVKDIAADPTRKIEAIKVYREETGAGLAEAKQAVEDYIRSRRQ
jgi:ribosomal protein L7/L12